MVWPFAGYCLPETCNDAARRPVRASTSISPTRRAQEREEAEVAALRAEAGSFEDLIEPLRAWNRERATHLSQWLALRLELWLYALRHEELRSGYAEREAIARTAIAGGVAHELAAHGVAPPADIGFLALILHALEDGLFIQRALTPDQVPPEAVVDAVDLLVRSWIALAIAQAGDRV